MRFSTSGFFHKSVSPWPLSMPLGSFFFSRKFAEIIANECLSAVSRTPAIKEKNFRYNFFSFFVKSLVECTFHLKINFLCIFILRYRQPNIGMTGVAGVVDTAKNLSAVSTGNTISSFLQGPPIVFKQF